MYLRDVPKKILVEISLIMLGNEEFNFNFPYDYYDNNLVLLRESSRWASIDLISSDVEFVCAFISENLDLLQEVLSNKKTVNQTITEFEIPKKNDYKVYYEVWGRATLTEKYYTEWGSYSKEWVKGSLRHSYLEGYFDYYDGKFLEYETDNFDADNFEVNSVENLSEQRKSLLSKLVVENTNDVLNDLDKETLIQLRNIINQKLSSF